MNNESLSYWRTTGFCTRSSGINYRSWNIHGRFTLLWRHNGRDGVSKHQHRECLLNRLFRHRSKKTSKLRVTGLCVGNSPVTGEFPAQRASNAENASIWWRHNDLVCTKHSTRYNLHFEDIITDLHSYLFRYRATTVRNSNLSQHAAEYIIMRMGIILRDTSVATSYAVTSAALSN